MLTTPLTILVPASMWSISCRVYRPQGEQFGRVGNIGVAGVRIWDVTFGAEHVGVGGVVVVVVVVVVGAGVVVGRQPKTTTTICKKGIRLLLGSSSLF